jgi:hypothetical protein
MAKRYVVRLAKSAGLILLFFLAALLGTVSGVLFAFAGDLPQISALDDYAPSTITRVYGSRGEVVGEFSTQRRVVIPYEAISPKLRQAIIAAEDAEFEQHFGLSMPHIAWRRRARARQGPGAITGSYSRPKGASTITQQLARGLFPQEVGYEAGDISLERKVKEAIVAVQIEKRYTKREILAFYANQMYLGEGAYGVEAAARAYFGKSAKDVNIDEAATIAGLFQTWRNAPTVNMERAKRRPGLRAPADGRRALHHAEGSRRGQGAPHRRRPVGGTRRFDRAVLHRGSAQGSRGALRRQAALRERAGRADRARHPAAGRGQPRGSTRACAASITRTASASRSATCSTSVTRSRATRIRSGIVPSAPTTSSPPVVVDSMPRASGSGPASTG